ncbi:hypothetical protein ACFXDJ_06920 [Streptomyces sp. NPDC059443]|uniref:hypothetical protein n=1 Tax=unclassified Streptomyces TaxID=2593676 RepID=UPI0036CC05ED
MPDENLPVTETLNDDDIPAEFVLTAEEEALALETGEMPSRLTDNEKYHAWLDETYGTPERPLLSGETPSLGVQTFDGLGRFGDIGTGRARTYSYDPKDVLSGTSEGTSGTEEAK